MSGPAERAGPGSWRALGRADELAPGEVRPWMTAGVRLAVGRTASGFFALDGICPHAGAVLGDGLVDGGLLVCPLHAFAFEVATGRCVDDEGCSVRSHPVRVRDDGVLEVRLPGRPAARGCATPGT